ncbi:hypothetical protein HNP46_000509 [Pseudomonas nitritireducens]|uniref:Uncharacterized protein n=1 Tax=Pseudomonas nitroreducens TaxID=46680 RepID=A0A7W7NYG4_PSENT|nr:hypothetical protein [Pseudomonas nitritireducens]MBB4861698.1 hypothetical protein [Pseudomonas nitritireducens]
MIPSVDYRAAHAFALANISELAGDVLHWRQRAKMKKAGKLNELANLCKPFSALDGHFNAARDMVMKIALEQAMDQPVAGPVVSPYSMHGDITERERDMRDHESYRRLMPKLVQLVDAAGQMSDPELIAWEAALPFDELIQYIGITHDRNTLKANVDAARRTLRCSAGELKAAS